MAGNGSPVNAARYVDAIVAYRESLATVPLRGAARADLLPGLRITNYRHSAVVAFLVDQHRETVFIVDIFYGGQDYEDALRGEDIRPDP
ncbi:type II toxin-antitoxin system RelE/ParE family toxin [Dyella jejuensis]|uniref:type II toxin-antitoxin system RelE/ParE family toxin n=1 Tax=Dyella jejuensis TaxID=1432009 RepID=UPI0038516051